MVDPVAPGKRFGPARSGNPRRVTPRAPQAGGASPWLVLGVAFAIGYLAARAVDWRGHAHPRR